MQKEENSYWKRQSIGSHAKLSGSANCRGWKREQSPNEKKTTHPPIYLQIRFAFQFAHLSPNPDKYTLGRWGGK